MQPDTIIPDQTSPQNRNRFSYALNNPIKYNDPDGHCVPLCSGIIGAAIGAMAGAISYTVNNNGDSFNAGEFWVATGAGALAGGLIGSGVGLLAGGAVAGSAVAATASSLIGAGTSATITGGSYIANNKNKFQTSVFVLQTGTAAVAGAVTSNPASSIYQKMFVNVVAAEAAYISTGTNHSVKGAIATAASAAILTKFQSDILDFALEDRLTIRLDMKSNLDKVSTYQQALSAQNTRTILYGTGSGTATSLAIGETQSIINKLEKKGLLK